MPQLLVRDVPQDVVEALKRRAAEHGWSAEAEHRLILEEALRAGRAGFWERAAALREATRAGSRCHRRISFARIVTHRSQVTQWRNDERPLRDARMRKRVGTLARSAPGSPPRGRPRRS